MFIKKILQKSWLLKILKFSFKFFRTEAIITTMAVVKLCCHNLSQTAYIMIFFVSSISYRPTDSPLLK